MARRAPRAGRAEGMLGLIVLAQTLTIAVSGPATSPEYLPLRVAEAEGYFAREGLRVELRTTRAESGAAEALAQAQADLTATSLQASLRFGSRGGGPVPRLVFGLTAAPPVALLVVSPGASAVHSVSDLKGLRVGVATPGAPEHAWFGSLLSRAGLSPGQVAVLSLGTQGLAAALARGEVAAGLVHDPLARRLQREGGATVLADFRSPAAVLSALGTPTVNAAVFVRARGRPGDRDLVALSRALLTAEETIRIASAAALAARLPERVVASPADFEARLETARDLYLTDGLVSVEQLRQTIRMISDHQPLPVTVRVPRPEEILHTGPLQRALTPKPPG